MLCACLHVGLVIHAQPTLLEITTCLCFWNVVSTTIRHHLLAVESLSISVPMTGSLRYMQ